MLLYHLVLKNVTCCILKCIAAYLRPFPIVEVLVTRIKNLFVIVSQTSWPHSYVVGPKHLLIWSLTSFKDCMRENSDFTTNQLSSKSNYSCPSCNIQQVCQILYSHTWGKQIARNTSLQRCAASNMCVFWWNLSRLIHKHALCLLKFKSQLIICQGYMNVWNCCSSLVAR